MNEYALHIGPKTRFLNFFRRAFTLPFAESYLVRKLSKKHHWLWEKLIPPNYLYKKGAVRKTNIDGISFLFDISNVVEHLAYFRIAPENFSLVEDALLSASVIFDIGANIGSTALGFARKNPGAKIFAFEPHPKTYQRAKTNIDINSFDNIQLVNKGMGAAKGTMKLYEVIDNNPGMNRIMPGDNPYPFVSVDITTLDEFCTAQGIEHIDFIKVDVEGFEYFVLQGGKKIISQSHPVIYLELYDHGLKKNGYSASALLALLYDMGYNFVLNAYTNTSIDASTDLTDCDFDIIARRQ